MIDMKDANGREIVLGTTAVVLDQRLELHGHVGTVGHTVRQPWGVFPATPRVRIDGPADKDGEKVWRAWCRPDDIAVVPGSGLPA
jgi:hypothetical protein